MKTYTFLFLQIRFGTHGKKVKILKFLRENSIVFSFIIREKNILFTETQG